MLRAMWTKYRFEHELDELERYLAQRKIIFSKPFLKNLYKKWYGDFIACADTSPKGKFLEIGSGGEQNAVITASFVYNAAMRNVKLPGKPAMGEKPETERRIP